jgi:hypothetical protein
MKISVNFIRLRSEMENFKQVNSGESTSFRLKHNYGSTSNIVDVFKRKYFLNFSKGLNW